MLSEEVRQLIAAYVDGEVSTRQRKQVDRLLRKSAEARALLEQLQRDSGELRTLSRHTLPQDFSLQVLKNIAEKRLQPATAPAPAPFPAWVGFGSAAAVLLLVTGASFLFFSSQQRPPENSAGPVTLAEKPLWSRPDLDLDAASTRALGDTLATDEEYRLDLTCQDPAGAVGRLEVALKENGIRLMVPQTTQTALKKEANIRYLLFAENVTPAELALLLQKVGGDDRRARAKGQRGAGFGRLLVRHVSTEDRQELSRLLGIGVKQLQPGATGRALDLKTPMRLDSNQQGNKGEDTAKSGPAKKEPERFALALAQTGAVSAEVASSPEIRAYLTRRGPARPGTLQVIVEIQPAVG